MTSNPSNVKKIPWFLPQIGVREKELIVEVLDSNYINDGEVTRLFETQVAKIIGTKYCVAVSSGTAAITLALMGLGIGPGDEVLVPDFTFIATANAVRLAGAEVKLVDIEPKKFSVDPECLNTAIGPKTRALLSVDVNGRSADYDLLERIAKEKGVYLISDSAEGLGSCWKGRSLGAFGQAGCFSFSANKTVTTGQGGMIATNNSDLYFRLLELKDQGRRKQGSGGNDLHPVMGYNFKLTNLQAALGLAQLERLPSRIAQARRRDSWYETFLSNCPEITLPSKESTEGEVAQWADLLSPQLSSIERALQENNIGYRRFWYPLHRQKPYAADDLAFPNAIEVSAKGLWLPSSFSLSREDVKQTAKVIRGALGKVAWSRA